MTKLALPLLAALALLCLALIARSYETKPPSTDWQSAFGDRVQGDGSTELTSDSALRVDGTTGRRAAPPAGAAPMRVEDPDVPNGLRLVGRVVRRVNGYGGKPTQLEPVAGANVELGPGSPPLVETTNDEGVFHFDFPNREGPMSCMLRARGGETYIDALRRVDFGPRERLVDDVILVLQAPPILKGRVVDPRGVGRGGIEIALRQIERTTTDATGRFAFEARRDREYASPYLFEETIAITSDGLFVLDIDVPGFDEEHAWQEISITVVPTTTLEIDARDIFDRPLDDEPVVVAIAPHERFVDHGRRLFGFQVTQSVGRTGANGIVQLANVPTGVHLEIEVGASTFQAVRGSELVKSLADSTTRPILLDPADRSHFMVRQGHRLRVSGRVFEPDGEPTEKAYVHLHAFDASGAALAAETPPVTTDGEGHFVARYRSDKRIDTLVVRATSARGEVLSKSLFGGTKRPDPLVRAWTQVGASLLDTGTVEVDLHMNRLGKISGRVLAHDGKPVGNAHLHLHSDQPSNHEGYAATSRRTTVSTSRSGEFAIPGLPPGEYTIVARSREHGRATFGGLEHDARDVELIFDDSRPARVTIELESDRPLASAYLASAILAVTDEDALDVLDPETRVVGHGRFPAAALSIIGVAGHTTAQISGSFNVREIGIEAPETVEVPPGPAWFGVRAHDADGRVLFPLGTGPVRVLEGDTRVVFALSPSTALEVRLDEAEDVGQLVFELHDASGQPIEWLGRGEDFETRGRVGSDGSISVGYLPAIPLELVVGTPRELDTGRPRWRRDLELTPGETLRVEF